MSGTAPYRALVEAGASEERAKEAAESVVHAPEGATKSDIAGVKGEVAGVKGEVAGVRTEVAQVRTEIAQVKTELSDRIAALEATMEWNFRSMTFRLIGAMFAMQALMLAALRFTGSG